VLPLGGVTPSGEAAIDVVEVEFEAIHGQQPLFL